MMITYIKVRETTGENAVVMMDGQMIYEDLRQHLVLGRRVVLDFSGVDIVTTPFLNLAIGQALGEFSPSTIDALLGVEHLPRKGETLVAEVLHEAREFYGSRRKLPSYDESCGVEIYGR